MARRGPWGADLQRGACAHHGCHPDGGRDVQVVEDLLEPWSAQLSDPETCRPSLGTGEGHGRVEPGLSNPGSRWSRHLLSMTEAGSGGWPLSTGCRTAPAHARCWCFVRLPPRVGRRTAAGGVSYVCRRVSEDVRRAGMWVVRLPPGVGRRTAAGGVGGRLPPGVGRRTALGVWVVRLPPGVGRRTAAGAWAVVRLPWVLCRSACRQMIGSNGSVPSDRVKPLIPELALA